VKKKLYYDINEVAAMEEFQCNTSKIRFYERKFNLTVARNGAGDRIYTEKDIQKLKEVFYLKKEKGFTIEGTKQELKKSSKSKDQKQTLIASLERFKGFLMEVKLVLSGE
jgi:DNA-binding transcriptional MerR regulator